MLYDYERSQHHATLVASAILHLQPRNGCAYDTPTLRQQRERIAVNVHQGNPPFDGVS